MASEDFNWISLILTGLALFVSAIMLLNYRDLRKKQTDPKIAIYYYPTDSWNLIKDLVIKNIGGGPAYDITFNVESDFDSEDDKLVNKNVIKNGIKFLAPGCKYQFLLAVLDSEFMKKPKKRLLISVEYYNNSNGKYLFKFWPMGYRDKFQIDLDELGNTPMIDRQGGTIKDIVARLDEMNSQLRTLGAKYKR